MTIYENIKAAISVKQAAEHYGLKVNRSGMTCCPFHNDRHPSLKLNEDYFFCFGCGAKGDVIDLVAKLFNLSNYEAAQKLYAEESAKNPDFKKLYDSLHTFQQISDIWMGLPEGALANFMQAQMRAKK